MTIAVVVAAGKGERMGGKADKVFLDLCGKPVLAHAVAAFDSHPDVDSVVLVVREDALGRARELVRGCGFSKVRAVVPGGATRLASVRAGLAACADADLVLVHDGARPCVDAETVSACIASARESGSGVAAAKAVDTVKIVRPGTETVGSTPDRRLVRTVQTPQAFRADVLRAAIAAADDADPLVTDEASAVERAGGEVRLVLSSAPNPKITVPEDLAFAALLLGGRP